MATTVPMLAPDGSSGEIPQDKVQDALKAGFKQAVQMTSPDGKAGFIPADRVQDATKAGFKMGASYDPNADPYRKRYDINLGEIVSGGLNEAGNMVKGTLGLFKPPQNENEALIGSGSLPFYRAGKALLQSTGTGLGQAYDYAKGGQPIRAAATVLGAINPLSSGQTASINARVDQGAPISDVIGQGLTDVTALAAPEVARVAAPVVSRVAGKTAVGLYRNALKPPPGSMTAAESTAKVQTGLENAIPVSAGGVEKLGDLVDDFNNKIAAELQSAPGRTIDPNAVATRIAPTKAQFRNQVNAGGDLAAIEASKQQFLQEQGAQPAVPAGPQQPISPYSPQGQANILANRPLMSPGTPAIPAQPASPMRAIDAQSMKQGTYSVLRKKYGEQGSATVEAQKALARGLKEEIATQFPEINDMNAAESKLLDLGPTLERAVNRISNNHTIGIGGPILAGGIKAATNSSGLASAVGVMKSIFDIPAIKSQVAIALSKGAKIPYPTALARVSAYQASLGSAVAGSQAYSSGDNSNQSATPAP